MDNLQKLLLQRLADLGTPGSPMSLRRAAERSNGQISYEVLRRIARGEHRARLFDSTVEGIAAALDLPVDRVYDAARITRPKSRWEMPRRFDRLDPAQRTIVEEHAAGYLESYEKGLRDGLRAATDDELVAEVARRGLRDAGD